MATFKELGVNEALCEAIERVKWTTPTEIQQKAIPPALEGSDIIGLAKTGSGKTGAFTIPIIQGLMKHRYPYYALIFTPTRELALQIEVQLKGLGKCIGIKCSTLIGGVDEKSQVERLHENPHVVIATPGRFLKHITTTKGFNQKTMLGIKVLVLDEADKMLSTHFEQEMNKILFILPKNKQTFLFSATNTDKVSKIQRATLKNPVKVSVDEKFAELSLLKEFIIIYPDNNGLHYLVWLLKLLTGMSEMPKVELKGFMEMDLYNNPISKDNKMSIVVFVNTVVLSNQLALCLNNLGFNAIGLNGQMSQQQRTAALNKMKMKAVDIVVASDVMSRGIDISNIDVVINYDLCENAKIYTHRIGRTARAGKEGSAFMFVNENEIEELMEITEKLGRKLPNLIDRDSYSVVHEDAVLDEKNITNCFEEAGESIRKFMKGKGKRRAFNIVDYTKEIKKKRK